MESKYLCEMGDLPHPSQHQRRRRQPRDDFLHSDKNDSFVKQFWTIVLPSLHHHFSCRNPECRKSGWSFFPIIGQPMSKPGCRAGSQNKDVAKRKEVPRMSPHIAPTNAGFWYVRLNLPVADLMRRGPPGGGDVSWTLGRWVIFLWRITSTPSLHLFEESTNRRLNGCVCRRCKRFLEVKNNQLERYFSSWIAPNILWPKRKSRKESTRPKNH